MEGVVLPGEMIGSKKDYFSGHGTYEEEGFIYSSLTGLVKRIDRLICVTPVKSFYRPDVGDVVVGRVVSVDTEGKRWRVDINSYQHARLLLTAINLPGGVVRKRSEEDMMNMR